MSGFTHPGDKELIELLRDWQAKEKDSIALAREIQRRSRNSITRLVMEIIAHDSVLHHRVEQFLLDTVEKSSVMIQPEEVEAVWEMIDQYNELEKSALDLVERSQNLPDVTPVQRMLLDYLQRDERRHDNLLKRLEEIKIKLHPGA